MQDYINFRDAEGKFINLYELIEVDQNASVAEVQKAYRAMAKKVHPDSVKDVEKREAEEKFKLLNLAKEVLEDDFKRKTYDNLYAIYTPRGVFIDRGIERAKERTFGYTERSKSEEFNWTAGPMPDPCNAYATRKWFERRPNNYNLRGTHPSHRPCE